MAKEGIISTSKLNCYGSRVLTEGGDLTQYKKNPVLLYMHRRAYDGKTMPIGRIENMRIEGDQIIGTPVFDEKDEFAKQIGQKWEDGFLRMMSAGIEILESSTDTALLVPGQTRATVTKWKLEEVSIVDIGGNDDALQLMHGGKLLTLAAGEVSDVLPLLELSRTDNADGRQPEANNNNKNSFHMKKETLQLLGLSETATEQEVHEKVQLLMQQADKAKTLELAAVKQTVETAIAEKRITEAQREHFMKLGKQIGAVDLKETLKLMAPAVKPTEVINPGQGANGAPAGEPKTFAKLSEVPADKVESMKKEQPKEYARLYKAEYGIDLTV